MFEVTYVPRSPQLLVPVLGRERVRQLLGVGKQVSEELDGRRVVSVNSTATGGGVAEMLPVLLAYAESSGVDGRWLVIEGDPEFFKVTKRLHHQLHGEPGDDGPLGQAEREIMYATWERNRPDAERLTKLTDTFLLHDPQPTPMARWLSDRAIPIVWRCHIGVDQSNQYTQAAWEFLRPMLEPYVDQYVFTRREYAPDWVPNDRLHVIRPALDPLAAKNREIPANVALTVLQKIGVVAGSSEEVAAFARADGSTAIIDARADVTTESLPQPETPLVVQVSRWDPLKDMAGVMSAFVNEPGCDAAHLVLAGPDVSSVSDDPEGLGVWQAVKSQWQELPDEQRKRVSIVSLPMTDPEANAIMVNSLQRHASVVVQKSIKEGFGLTVTEAMFKGRPVVASAVGGIVAQIRDGVDGVLVDPFDLAAAGRAVAELLADPNKAETMGRQAREAVIGQFMPDSSLLAWAQTLDAAILHKLR